MTDTVTLKGKEKLFNYFEKQKCAYWKLLNFNTRKVIAANTSKKQFSEAYEDLKELVESVDPDEAYIIELYAFALNGDKQSFTRPYATMPFSIDEDYKPKSPVISNTQEQPTKRENEFSGKMTLDSHLHLIGENSRLIAAEAFQSQRIKELEAKIAELQADNDHLNSIIDDYEEEEEEENEADQKEKVAGQTETPMSIMANFIKENGKDIVNAVLTKKEKVNVNQYQPPEQPIQDQEQPGAAVNGVGNTIQLPDLNVIVKQLQGIDPLFHEHLFKLLLIGQQKPETFKLLLSQLDNF